jgi:hypothetical protein
MEHRRTYRHPTADAESLKKYFAAHAKALLDKGVTIQQVNGIKTLFTVFSGGRFV